MAANDKHKLYMNMDKALHDEVKRVAEIEHRSVSAQIHALLYEILEQRKSKA